MMLSIVCPIYNEVRYIKGCIESIVAQDYPKDSLEVLFVDGMSLDGTRDVVQQFMSLYPFIKLILCFNESNEFKLLSINIFSA